MLLPWSAVEIRSRKDYLVQDSHQILQLYLDLNMLDDRAHYKREFFDGSDDRRHWGKLPVA